MPTPKGTKFRVKTTKSGKKVRKKVHYTDARPSSFVTEQIRTQRPKSRLGTIRKESAQEQNHNTRRMASRQKEHYHRSDRSKGHK